MPEGVCSSVRRRGGRWVHSKRNELAAVRALSASNAAWHFIRIRRRGNPTVTAVARGTAQPHWGSTHQDQQQVGARRRARTSRAVTGTCGGPYRTRPAAAPQGVRPGS